MSYLVHLLVYLGIYSIVAMSLNIVTGYCGLITMAHAGFFAIGGYACGLAMVCHHWSFLPAMVLGVALSAVASLLVSLPSQRLKGDSFVLLSLAVQVIIFGGIYNWSKSGHELGTLQNLTNGPFGVSGIPKPSLGGLVLDSPLRVAILAVALAAGCATITWLLSNSPWGRLLRCMRDDELALRGLGRNTHALKVQAFAVSCGMAAVAGALYATYVGYIDPSSASLNEAILMLSMVMVGGLGNLRGPLVGAVLLLALPELLRLVHVPDIAAANIRLMIYGLMLVLMMRFRPQGVAGVYRMD